MLRPFNRTHRIHLLDSLSMVDGGDVPVVPGNVQETYRRMVDVLVPIFEKGMVPICLGGDHSISLGVLRAAAEVHGPLSLVHFDAHSDTWDKYYESERYTHGTPFRRAAEEGLIVPRRSIQVGMRGPLYSSDDLRAPRELGFEVITSEDLFERGVDSVLKNIHQRIGDHPAYVTFDVDFLDPSVAPGTGTPEVGGPSVRTAIKLVQGLDGLSMQGFDCVEVLPLYDPGQITCAAACAIVFEMMSLVALEQAPP